MVDIEKDRECKPCCHNGHGVKKIPVKAPGGKSWICWLESCKKTVARLDENYIWQFDPCDHVKREAGGAIVFR